MNYPVWVVPHIGGGWVIGLIAIYHVMISHFAVGGGLYLVLAERKALRENRRDWLEILHGHAKFFLILTGVFGAVSGVGIWFAIGLVHPEATSTLIHNFVFAWAIEWVFFMVELTTAAVYYYTWGRIPKEQHLKVGWLYAIASFFTLFIINGILTFMLTPGQPWLAIAGSGQEASRFWSALFNPTYWPSLLLRTLVCLSLAGVWALVTCSRLNGEANAKLKAELVRWSARWLIPSFLLMPLAMAWYLMQVPEGHRALLDLGISTIGTGAFTQVTRVALIVIMTSATIVFVVYFFAWRAPQDFTFAHAVSVLVLALAATASGEYGRESLRKPFVIGQHMFSNGVRTYTLAAPKLAPAAQPYALDQINTQGYLTGSRWPQAVTNGNPALAKGEAMFRGQCLACHTHDVYRSMKRLLAGRNREAIASLLTVLHEYKSDSPYQRYMPQLVGKPDEIEALGDYLATLSATNKTPALATTNNPKIAQTVGR